MKKLFPLLCTLSAIPCPAATAPASTASTGQISAVSASPAAGMPAPEMSALYPRIGKWAVTIRSSPGENSPRGGIDHGVMTISKGPGGFSIVQDFRSQGASGRIVGQSYAWWDAQARAYKTVWCDNQQGCVEFVTAIAGNTWSTELDSTSGNDKVHTVIRAAMSADHNAIHEEVTSSHHGGPARTESVSDYKRIRPAARRD